MTEILHNTSSTVLTQAIEENMFAFRSNFGLLPGSELHDDADKLWYINPVPHPFFNTIYRARFTRANHMYTNLGFKEYCTLSYYHYQA